MEPKDLLRAGSLCPSVIDPSAPGLRPVAQDDKRSWALRCCDEGGRNPAHRVRGTRWHCVATGVRFSPPTTVVILSGAPSGAESKDLWRSGQAVRPVPDPSATPPAGAPLRMTGESWLQESGAGGRGHPGHEDPGLSDRCNVPGRLRHRSWPPPAPCHPERSPRRGRSRRISGARDRQFGHFQILRLRGCAPSLRMTRGSLSFTAPSVRDPSAPVP